MRNARESRDGASRGRMACSCSSSNLQSDWRASCFDCGSAFFERSHLLFADRQLEAEYLTRKRNRTARYLLLAALIAEGGAFSAWLSLDIVISGTNTEGISVSEKVVLVLIAVFALLGCAATIRAVVCPQHRYYWTAVGAFFAMSTVQVDVFSEVLWYNVFPNTSLDESVCNPALNASEYSIAAYEARQCGSVQPLPPNCILLMAILWATQSVVLALNVVATRLFVAIVPFTAITLLLIGGLIVANTVPWPEFDCLSFIQNTAVTICFDLFFWAIGSSIAFVIAVARREAATRELFVWNRRLNLDAKQLQLEADPFHPDNVKRWLQNAQLNQEQATSLSEQTKAIFGRTHDDANSDVSTVSPNAGNATFWSIPPSSLELDHKIASGSGGAVWKATYKGTTPVAAKELFSTAVGPNVDELAHEAALLGQLLHPNVVKFLGLCALPADLARFRTSPQLFIVQELCAGNLRNVIGTPWGDDLQLLSVQIASGMAYLHERGVVHRDLKPENIFLAADGTARIGDFGVSSQQPVLSVGRLATETSLKAAAGTVQYLPPEVYVVVINQPDLPLQAASAPVDVYAFGIILWELLAGSSVDTMQVLGSLRQCTRTSLREQSTNLSALMSGKWQWPPATKMSSTAPAVFTKLAARCWDFQPDRRPTFVAIENELKSFVTQQCESSASSIGDLGADHRQECVSAPGRLEDNLNMPLLPGSSSGYASVQATQDGNCSPLLHSTPAIETIVSELDGQSEPPTKQVAACWHRCWHSCGLHFRSHDMEAQFVGYLRSNEFYSVLRWPYLVFACMYLAQLTVTIVVVDSPMDVVWIVGPFLRCVLFGVAAVFAWCLKRTRRPNSVFFSILAFLYVSVGAVVTLSMVADTGLTANETEFLTVGDYQWAFPPMNASTVFWEDALVRDQRSSHEIPVLETRVCAGRVVCDETATAAPLPAACAHFEGETVVSYAASVLFQAKLGATQYMMRYGLYVVEGLNAPVMLMLFGLPFRNYIWIVAIPALTLLVKAYSAFEVGTIYKSDLMPAQWNFDFHFVAAFVVVPLVYSSCATSVLLHERSQRKLFVLYCGLQNQKFTLSRDVAFRQYRRIMESNREFFSRRPKVRAPGGGQQQVALRAVTIN
eukprot:INCI4249.1.p1 GENE.INCI4249.1~~INCI4249.1.p1  ORF type:complete len:1124 (-),score=164.17 INCI4249.1:23-3394(-)